MKNTLVIADFLNYNQSHYNTINRIKESLGPKPSLRTQSLLYSEEIPDRRTRLRSKRRFLLHRYRKYYYRLILRNKSHTSTLI